MELRVIGMSEGRRIPDKFTCSGKNHSPKIEIHDRNETGYYFIVMNDPDAPSGLFTHWIIYNIPAGIVTLEENIGNKEITEEGYYQGLNDFGEWFFPLQVNLSGILRPSDIPITLNSIHNNT